MTAPPIVKRVYDAAALFALVNLAALGAAGGYLFATGAVDAGRLSRVGAVLRGEELPAADPAEASSAAASEDGSQEEPSEGKLAESEMSLEIMRREADRIKEELRQQLALANSIMLRVETERDAYRRERETDSKEEEAADRIRNAAGLKRFIGIIRKGKPKASLQYLLAIEDLDDAVEVFLSIDERNASKIAAAATSPEQVARMQEILERLRTFDPQRSSELQAGKP